MKPEMLEVILPICTPRQKQVAILLIERKRTGEIAQHLGISRGRVQQHYKALAKRIAKAESDARFREVVRRFSLGK